MNQLFLQGHNNYFNRQIKIYQSLENYQNDSDDFFIKTNIDFNPNDGVNTTQVVNTDNIYYSDKSPDYLVCYDEENHIKSRWFVTEWTRLRGKQYRATLRRDVIADNYQAVKNAPIFVERGPLSKNNKMIFNSEGLSFNQIKKSQETITDETGKAWIVGYLNRDLNQDKTISSISYGDTAPIDIGGLGIVLNTPGDITKGGYIEHINERNGNPVITAAMDFYTRLTYFTAKDYYKLYRDVTPVDNSLFWSEWFFAAFEDYPSAFMGLTGDIYKYAQAFGQALNPFHSEVYDTFKRDLLNLETNVISTEDYNDVLADKERLVSYDGKVYKMTFRGETRDTRFLEVTNNNAPATRVLLENAMNYVINNVYPHPTPDYRGNPLQMHYVKYRTAIYFTEVKSPELRTVTIKAGRNKLADAPYDMYCMEYDEYNLALAQSIAKELGGTNSMIIDTQLLPYCPARFALNDIINGYPTPTTLNTSDYSDITVTESGQSKIVSRMYYPKRSSLAFSIPKHFEIPDRTDDEALNIKLSNECDYYRLSAPNFSSSFEFSLAKNGGSIDLFNISFTYRPISPYLRVEPVFREMYGENFKDSRGLICGGDYSIDVLSSNWINYQIQNKNYENIFNTKIKSMDYQHEQSKTANIAGVGTSTAKGLIDAAIISKDPASKALGAAAGLATGITNLVTGENKYRDQRQLEIDMYEYQLGNIKAQPDTLTKISAYNIDNNYFPVLEYYTATDEEIEYMKKKIQFQGYKIMAITTIRQLPIDSAS